MERIIELLEEQNELVRENSQLLGDVLNSLDNIGNRQSIVNNVVSASTNDVVPEIKRGPVPTTPDVDAIMLAIHGTTNENELLATHPDFDVFWPKDSPKSKVPHDWVRVSIKHPNSDSLNERVKRGCLCGRPIVLKEHDGSSFYTCEALAQKGSCQHRPAAYFDKLTFLTNVPPQR